MRSLTPRAGTSAIELLLVLILAVGFAAALLAVVRMAASHTTLAVQRAAASRDHIALWALTTHDLAHAAVIDVAVPATDALEYDRPIGEGPTCASEPFAILIPSDRGWFTRSPSAGRDQLLAREPTFDGTWLRRGIVSVGMANCPDGRPALRLLTDTPIPPVGFARVVEPVRLRSYPSADAYAIGLEGRGGGATIQPLAGPILPTGLQVSLPGPLVRFEITRPPLAPLTVLHPLEPVP